jgi:hypothetical protein
MNYTALPLPAVPSSPQNFKLAAIPPFTPPRGSTPLPLSPQESKQRLVHPENPEDFREISDLLLLNAMREDSKSYSKRKAASSKKRPGFKRAMLWCLAIAILLGVSYLTVKREVQFEEQITTSQQTERKRVLAIAAVEVLLLSANGLAAVKVFQLSRSWVWRSTFILPKVLRIPLAPVRFISNGSKLLQGGVKKWVNRRAANLALSAGKGNLITSVARGGGATVDRIRRVSSLSILTKVVRRSLQTLQLTIRMMIERFMRIKIKLS